jgi:hypothetical protein
VRVATRFEGGFAGGLDERVEVGNEGVEVVGGQLLVVCLVVCVMFEHLLPFFFEFGVGIVSGGSRGWDKVEASDGVES